MTQPGDATERAGRIDVDVHQGLPEAFWDRLGLPWSRMRPTRGVSWPASALGHTGYRTDVHTEEGVKHDTTPDDVVARLLDPYEIDVAILNGNAGALGINTHPNPHFALAFAQAYNDWLVDTWLPHDPRLRASMYVTPHDPAASVAEIERIGGHRGIVQVLMAASSPKLYGDRAFWPIYEAATSHDLPVAIHPTGGTTLAPTASGWPSTYLEAHTMIATRYLNHMVSLVCQGAFEEIPGMRFVFVEGGVTTFAPLLWRLEKNWKGVRAEVPWLTRSPREYLASNIRFSTQPIEEPSDRKLLLGLFRDLDAARTLMYASDWPHWDFDDADAALRPLDPELRQRVLFGTAADTYRLNDPTP
jgi:predicted TIM-barrel fold metal-dependent hydrolase